MRYLLRLSIGVLVVGAIINAPAAAQAPPPPADPSATGAQLFASTCGFCHQNGGRAPGRGPKLAGTERPDEFIVNRIRLGKEGAMPAYGRAFSDAQIRSLVAYIRSLKDDSQ